MKKVYVILSAISFILYALVDFAKGILETHFYIQLMNGKVGNFSCGDYFVNAGMCQLVLFGLAIVCLVLAVAETMKDRKK